MKKMMILKSGKHNMKRVKNKEGDIPSMKKKKKRFENW